PLRIEAMTESGRVFYRQTNTWIPRPLDLQTAPGETQKVTFAFQSHQITQQVELGPETESVTLEQQFDFDNYGNQILHTDYGIVLAGDRFAGNDERVSTNKF